LTPQIFGLATLLAAILAAQVQELFEKKSRESWQSNQFSLKLGFCTPFEVSQMGCRLRNPSLLAL